MIELLKKLKALADLKKEEVEPRYICEKQTGLHDCLIDQIIWKVIDSNWNRLRHKYDNSLYIECTQSQQIEIQSLFAFYGQELEAQQKRFYVAFLHKHSIFPDSDGSKEKGTITREEREKIINMARGMDDSSIHKQIS